MANDIIFEGGSEANRARLLQMHETYLDANNRLDVETLRKAWDDGPGGVYFNLNGHTYRGFDHWAKLWAFYRTQFRTIQPWTPFDTKVVIGTDMAVITCSRTCRLEWIGENRPETFTEKDLTSRSTEVFAKRNGDWRVIHVHFSPASEGPRPGKI
jgi:hypothetical protein